MNEHLCDMHCHVLPGIDDGSRDWNMSMEMIRRSHQAGIDTIIATSHYLPWNQDIIAERIPDLCKEAMQRARETLHIEIRIVPGQELYYHVDLPKALESGKALTLARSPFVLVEFSEQVHFREMVQAFEQLQNCGYEVVLAHCERFGCLRRGDRVEQLVEEGVWLQSNVHEMDGPFYNETKRWLSVRYQKKQISFIGSDMHNLGSRPPMDRGSLKWFRNNLDPEYFQTIFSYNGNTVADFYKSGSTGQG